MKQPVNDFYLLARFVQISLIIILVLIILGVAVGGFDLEIFEDGSFTGCLPFAICSLP
jgi:uncharacterized membrane protein YwzB